MCLLSRINQIARVHGVCASTSGSLSAPAPRRASPSLLLFLSRCGWEQSEGGSGDPWDLGWRSIPRPGASRYLKTYERSNQDRYWLRVCVRGARSQGSCRGCVELVRVAGPREITCMCHIRHGGPPDTADRCLPVSIGRYGMLITASIARTGFPAPRASCPRVG